MKYSIFITLLLFSLPSFGQKSAMPNGNLSGSLKKKEKQANQDTITPSEKAVAGRSGIQKPKIEVQKGSVSVDLAKESLNEEQVSKNLSSWINLPANNSFKKVKTNTEENGDTHSTYKQTYKGFVIDNNTLFLHSKNNKVKFANGRIAESLDVNTQIYIKKEDALSIAKSNLNVSRLINEYPIETVITEVPGQVGADKYRLAHKIRIDSFEPFVMSNVYVDVITGQVINRINLIAHADVVGTGQTIYSGNQSITFDNFSGGYRLRDGGRKIETYNATNATGLTTSGFTGATDFINSSTSWEGIPILTSITISTISQSWWYTTFADELPDLYIMVKNSSGQTVYTSNYLNNANTPITFNNINVLLSESPYTLELWDYDVIGEDDFGGSYVISSEIGENSWSGNGNSGKSTVSDIGNPAVDVHWGMETTYDFYLNVLNRDSYDGNGGAIKQYYNPPTLQSQLGESPNNAYATPEPYNIMSYGMGDGQYMNPVVGLDVTGHEYTHLVVDQNGNGGLVYQGESGALNESFSDIFGTSVEFYANNNPDWFIGEDIMVAEPFLRSMSNPNDAQQPDTYNGLFWTNPSNLEQDQGGVHTNSGVQNFWFYLLSEGGTGTNDLGNPYTVTGIGLAQAQQIAYRNLTTYLGPNATYQDAYVGSLLAAKDLYGNPSTQYNSVRQAWYAVGIGNDPNNFCSGTLKYTASSASITDGSDIANYNNDSNCTWLIAPPGATKISLTFGFFDTEESNDIVYVYDGPNDGYPVLASWWGNTLPPTIETTNGNGAMFVKFISDGSVTGDGWSAVYNSVVEQPSCSGVTVLSEPIGSLSDGSGAGNYGNNQLCYWFIAPPCASDITLTFNSFNTEQDYDGVVIYDDLTGTNELATLTGTSLPSPVTSLTGEMLVVFISDFSTTSSGFSANYTSNGSSFCSGTTTLNTTDNGTISDGSGSSDYCNNVSCSWLIQPPEATSVTLNFTSFDLEQPSSDGNTIYDAVEVYDGPTTSSPLIGRYSGSNIPPAITSTGGSLLINFYSDLGVSKQGWDAYYTSTQAPLCAGTTLTSATGSFDDGSGSKQYANNLNCSWLIQPPNANSITLSFSEFNTELNYDGVIIYDGVDNSASVLGQFSGSTIPEPISSSTGSMYMEFITDPAERADGWKASYTATIVTGLNENPDLSFEIFPNPTNGVFTLNSSLRGNQCLTIYDAAGQQVLRTHEIGYGENKIDVSNLKSGVLIIKVIDGDKVYSKRLMLSK